MAKNTSWPIATPTVRRLDFVSRRTTQFLKNSTENDIVDSAKRHAIPLSENALLHPIQKVRVADSFGVFHTKALDATTDAIAHVDHVLLVGSKRHVVT